MASKELHMHYDCITGNVDLASLSRRIAKTGLTQAAFAKAAGMPDSQLCRLLKGRNAPRALTLARVEAALTQLEGAAALAHGQVR